MTLSSGLILGYFFFKEKYIPKKQVDLFLSSPGLFLHFTLDIKE